MMSKKMLVAILAGLLVMLLTLAGCSGQTQVTGAGTASGAKDTEFPAQPVSDDSKQVAEELTPAAESGAGGSAAAEEAAKQAEAKDEARANNNTVSSSAKQDINGSRQTTENTTPPTAKPEQKVEQQQVKGEPVSSAKVLAYYLHGTVKGSCCTSMENEFKAALAQNFPGQLQQGKVAFISIDVDKPENRHYLEDFQVPSRSLVLVLQKNGENVKWSNMVGVWLKLGDQEKFSQYVKDEVGKFLQEAV